METPKTPPKNFGLKGKGKRETPLEPSPLAAAEAYARARVPVTADADGEDAEPFDFEVADAREREAEDMLGKGLSPRAVRSALAKKYKVTRQHASTWVAAVHRTWRAESTPEERENTREQIKETAWHGVHLAFGRKGMALDKDGGEHYFANPDVAAARGMLETLAAVSGVKALDHAPIVLNISMEQRVEGAMKALHGHYFPGAAPVVDALPVSIEGDDSLSFGTEGDGDGGERK